MEQFVIDVTQIFYEKFIIGIGISFLLFLLSRYFAVRTYEKNIIGFRIAFIFAVFSGSMTIILCLTYIVAFICRIFI